MLSYFAHQPFVEILINSKQALTEEQPKVSSHISNDGIKIIEPVLKSNDEIHWKFEFYDNLLLYVIIPYLFLKLVLSVGE